MGKEKEEDRKGNGEGTYRMLEGWQSTETAISAVRSRMQRNQLQ